MTLARGVFVDRPSGLFPLNRRPLATGQLLLAFLVLLGAAGLPARASDPVGIYALVDKVVLEPGEKSPERIQIWGAFAIAKGSGDTYESAQRGYLFFKLKPGDEIVCKKEWADLKAVAGTRQCVAFGFRHADKGRVRKADEKAENPEVYPVAFGLTKVRETDYKPVKELLALPASEKSKTNKSETNEKTKPAGEAESKRAPTKAKP